MNNKDKTLSEIEHIMNLHNGELGVTWEDPDVVTPDTIAKLIQLIQEERREAVVEELEKARNTDMYDRADYIDARIEELTKGGTE